MEIETATFYAYKAGTAEEITHGSEGAIEDGLQELILQELILNIDQTAEKIYLPRFIGVYEMKKAIRKDEEDAFQIKYRALQKHASLCLRVREINEGIPNNLVAIGHDSELNSGVVKLFFIDPLQRLAIHPFSNLPNFQENLSEGLLTFLNEKCIERRIPLKEMGSRFPEEIKTLRKDRARYGLTRENQVLLETYSFLNQ